MKVLLTGASGFVGSALAAYFQNWQIVTTGRRPGVDVSADLLKGREAIAGLIDQVQPGLVLHCAGVKDVRWCEANVAEAFRINAEVPALLAQEASRVGARMVYVSTDLVFAADRGSYREGDPPDSEMVYGRSKAAGEKAVLEALPEAVICRTGGVFGKTSPLLRWLGGELRAGKSVEAFTDVKNTPTYVNDLGAMIEGLVSHGEKGIFHTVGSESVSRLDWFRAFALAAGLDDTLLKPGQVGERYRELLLFPDSSLSSEKVKAALPFRAHSLREAFAEILETK